MGTHPIFESDFDCLTDMSKANIEFADSLWECPIRQEKINRYIPASLS